MSEVAKRLQQRRLNVWNENKALLEQVAEENRSFTAEEEGRIAAYDEEMDKLDDKIRGVLGHEKHAQDAEKAFDDVMGRKPALAAAPGYDAPGHADSGGADADAEIRAFLKGERKHVELAHNPNLGPLNLRVLQTNTAAASATVPTDFYDRLIAHLIEVSGVMQAGPTVLNTAGGENLQIPKTTSHGLAALTGQGAALSANDPAMSLVTLSSYKYGKLLQLSREMVDDTGVDLIGYLAMAAGRAVGNAFGTDLILGTGASQPTGLISATSASPGVTQTTTGQAGIPTYANLVDLEYSVIAPYRQSKSCYWIARDASVGALRKIVDTQGRPIWEPSAVLGSPDLLLGKPLVADPFMPAAALSAVGAYAFGDFAQFFVRLVGGVRFERSDDFAFGTDLVSFRCLLRGDGVLVDTNAIKVFKAANT